MQKSALAKRLAIGLSAIATLSASCAQAQSNEEKLRSMAQFYGIATYALGANEKCDLLDAGEYRAMVVLRDALSGDLSRATTKDVLASLSHTANAQREWKGCLPRATHGKQWGWIDQARLMGHALQAAPAAMTGDPGECAMDDYRIRLPRADWTIAATMVARDHGGADRASFEGLQKMFAGLIDADCARGSMSRLLQAGFDALWQIENNAKAGEGTSPGSSLAGKYESVVAAKELGAWRLRHGPFTGSLLRDGLNAYRLKQRGDANTAFIHLTSVALFGGPDGRLLFSQKGGWTIRLGGNAAAVQLRLSDGTVIPFTKLSGSGSVGLGSSRFDMPKASLATLAGKPDATKVQLAWQDDDGKWTLFHGLGKKSQVQTFTLGQLRGAIAWATVPRAMKEETGS